MAFGRKKDEAVSNAPAPAEPLQTYDVIYRGGLRELPKPKSGKIKFEIFPDRFRLLPTMATKKFWQDLDIPYSTISSLTIEERTLSSFEGLAGGINSRQLNQKNNIHITYTGAEGNTLLRLEMLSGVTVMGQAGKCNELEDRLRSYQVREQFRSNAPAPAIQRNVGGLAEEIGKLVSLRDQGVLTDEEFAAAKARLIGS